MRLPRRVPWSRPELAELYDQLFGPAASDISRHAALSRMSIYIASPSCPAFMHLLHGLVAALLLPHPPRSAADAAAARMAYAMALVRFVNGMVDPLQTGSHARPISHLAATLGLPPALVALRHRATHEDLPPLPLLRAALAQCVEYLHRASFLPLLATDVGWERRSRAGTLVARWKRTQKARVRGRDVSKESESGKAVRVLLRDAEGEDVEDVLEAVVRTGLVPVARKKRPNRRATAPPAESVQLWTPLLAHLAGTHPALPGMLAQQIMDVMEEGVDAEGAEGDEEQRREAESFRWTLGVWLLHQWGDGPLRVPDDERAGVLRRLARSLVRGDDVVRRVYAHLDAGGLADLAPLLPEPEEDGLQGLELDDGEDTEDAEALARMEANVAALEDRLRLRAPRVEESTEAVPGWSRAEGWAPCPIGVWA